MLADNGTLSPIETARAAVQEKIADFLAARARLIRLMNNPSLQIQGEARGLYANQTALEDQLQNTIYPMLSNIQKGVWDLGNVITLGSFTSSIIKQLSDVNRLEAQGGGVSSSSGFDISTLTVAVPVLLVSGLFVGYMLYKKG